MKITRKVLSVMMAMIIMAAAFPIGNLHTVAADKPTLRLEAPEKCVPGETIEIKAYLDNAVGFDSGWFILEWNDSSLEYCWQTSHIPEAMTSGGKISQNQATIGVQYAAPTQERTILIASFLLRVVGYVRTDPVLSFSVLDGEIEGIEEPETAEKMIVLSDNAAQTEDDVQQNDDAEQKIVASGECGAEDDNVTWTLDSEGTLTLKGTGATKNYKYTDGKSSSPFTEYLDDIKSIVVSEGISAIGDALFSGCRLSYGFFDQLPKSLERIGNYAFSGCSYDGFGFRLPLSVRTIGDYAFSECSGQSSDAFLSENIEQIGVGAFAGCSFIEKFYITNETFGYSTPSHSQFFSEKDGALYSADGVALIAYPSGSFKSVCTLPLGVKKIEEKAFAGCNDLSTVVFPCGIEEIRSGAFFDCSQLSAIILPSGTVTVCKKAFEKCSELSDIYFLGNKDDWKQVKIDEGNSDFTSAEIHYLANRTLSQNDLNEIGYSVAEFNMPHPFNDGLLLKSYPTERISCLKNANDYFITENGMFKSGIASIQGGRMVLKKADEIAECLGIKNDDDTCYGFYYTAEDKENGLFYFSIECSGKLYFVCTQDCENFTLCGSLPYMSIKPYNGFGIMAESKSVGDQYYLNLIPQHFFDDMFEEEYSADKEIKSPNTLTLGEIIPIGLLTKDFSEFKRIELTVDKNLLDLIESIRKKTIRDDGDSLINGQLVNVNEEDIQEFSLWAETCTTTTNSLIIRVDLTNGGYHGDLATYGSVIYKIDTDGSQTCLDAYDTIYTDEAEIKDVGYMAFPFTDQLLKREHNFILSIDSPRLKLTDIQTDRVIYNEYTHTYAVVVWNDRDDQNNKRLTVVRYIDNEGFSELTLYDSDLVPQQTVMIPGKITSYDYSEEYMYFYNSYGMCVMSYISGWHEYIPFSDFEFNHFVCTSHGILLQYVPDYDSEDNMKIYYIDESDLGLPQSEEPSEPGTTETPTTTEVPPTTEAPTTTDPVPAKDIESKDPEKAVVNADKKQVTVLPGRTADELKDLLGGGVTITDADGKEIDSGAKVGTGALVKTADGAEYNVVVPGDTDGDGKVGAADARNALRASAKIEPLSGAFEAAADISGDAKVKASDARSILRIAAKLDSSSLKKVPDAA